MRSTQQAIDFSKIEVLPVISDFHIRDNGVGFNAKNYESFNFAHSTYKYEKGGKGIGRFTWLRAFSKAEIESRFYEDGSWNLRTFNFEPTKLGIEKHQLGKVNGTEERYTVVKLYFSAIGFVQTVEIGG